MTDGQQVESNPFDSLTWFNLKWDDKSTYQFQTCLVLQPEKIEEISLKCSGSNNEFRFYRHGSRHVPAWIAEEIRATYEAARYTDIYGILSIMKIMTDRLGYGAFKNIPPHPVVKSFHETTTTSKTPASSIPLHMSDGLVG